MRQLNYDDLIARLEMLEKKLYSQPQQENSRETTSMNLAMSRLRYAILMILEAKKSSLSSPRSLVDPIIHS